VAVIKDGEIIAVESSLKQKSHSENLNVFVQDCLRNVSLQLNDVDIFAVGQGPGSFTGIRVAANAGKSFAYAYKKPLVTIDSLTLLAAPVRTSKRVLSIINAYKNMVYLGLFESSADSEPKFLHGPIAIPVLHLHSLINEEVLVVGDGYSTYQQYLPPELASLMKRDLQYADHPTAETLGLLAEKRAKLNQTIEWNSYTPLYIRASEAEESKRGIVITPLK
ncbi:MAG: tRNA (adenosine(37)-N6)-threonylcarbamoyltransferase complex dimerization subunit type 1 TsaB, partial [Proteobacteria bacterium]